MDFERAGLGFLQKLAASGPVVWAAERLPDQLASVPGWDAHGCAHLVLLRCAASTIPAVLCVGQVSFLLARQQTAKANFSVCPAPGCGLPAFPALYELAADCAALNHLHGGFPTALHENRHAQIVSPCVFSLPPEDMYGVLVPVVSALVYSVAARILIGCTDLPNIGAIRQVRRDALAAALA